MQAVNEQERALQAAASVFVDGADVFQFSLCKRSFLYQLTYPESDAGAVTDALEQLQLPIVEPMAPTRRGRKSMVICPDGAPVSHVARQIHVLGGTDLVVDFNTVGLVKRGRAVVIYLVL